MTSHAAEPSLPDKPYVASVDEVDEAEWYRTLSTFDDANLFQTWAYGAERWPRSALSHLVLRRGGEADAAAQVRIARVPLLPGVAYVRWGPLWRRGREHGDWAALSEVVRALRHEYVRRRGMVLRVIPNADENDDRTRDLFESEGFTWRPSAQSTLAIDLEPSLDELRRGLVPRWRTDLNRSQKNDLTVIEGTGPDLFDRFESIYSEMMDRKQLVDLGEVDVFRRIQARLPESWKMKVMICEHAGAAVAGAITSARGSLAVAILWASNLEGRKQKGAYLLQWRLLEWLKSGGYRRYDLAGVSREANPGGYRFKKGLAGRNGVERRYLGSFDAAPNRLAGSLIVGAESVRSHYRRILQGLKRRFPAAHRASWSAKPAGSAGDSTHGGRTPSSADA